MRREKMWTFSDKNRNDDISDFSGANEKYVSPVTFLEIVTEGEKIKNNSGKHFFYFFKCAIHSKFSETLHERGEGVKSSRVVRR